MLTTEYRSTAAYIGSGQLMPLQVLPTAFAVWNREMTVLLDAMHQIHAERTKDDPPIPQNILYVGCGRRLPFHDCWCVDLDPNVGEGIPHFKHADALSLPFEDARFSWSLSSHTLEHLDDCRAALCEQCRVVKLGGLVGAIVPDVRWTKGLDPDHKREWSLDEFASEHALVSKVNKGLMGLKLWGVAESSYSFFCVWQREV